MLSEEENNAIAAKKEQQRLSDLAIAEFLARGGKVQVIAPGKSGVVPGSGGNMWGRGRKKATPEAAAVADVPQEELAEELLEEDALPLSSDDGVFPESPELFDLSDDDEAAEEEPSKD
jgi:hypothetical protein